MGDTVFDPYMGSGTTVVAALKNGRKGLGRDTEQKYIDIATENIYDALYGYEGVTKSRVLTASSFLGLLDIGVPKAIPKRWVIGSCQYSTRLSLVGIDE